MKKYLSISIASILAIITPGVAKAQIYVTADFGGLPTVSGATLENFDESTPPSILSFSGAAYLVNNRDYGFLQPYFSGSTAAFFGESPANGFDNSQYVGVAFPGSATLSFPTPQNYFGILWASIDLDNSLTFYDTANNVVGTLLGADVPGRDGTVYDQTLYVNVTSTLAFSRVVVSNSGNGFEFDDVAYAMVVPEPASSVLLIAGLCVLGFALRRKFSKPAGIELD